MPDLAAFQRRFADAIAGPQPTRDALSVYRNTSMVGAVDALRANYPIVATIVGERMFSEVAADFAEAFPPRSPTLARYGEGFADYVEEQLWAAELPYLADVARIDRLYVEALFAADVVPFDAAALGALDSPDWFRIKARLHPATQFGWFTTPAASIWLAHQVEDRPSDISPEWCAEGALLTRPSLGVDFRRISRPEHRLLFGIRLGETIGSAAVAAAKLYPEADIGPLFVSLVNAGAFAGLTLDERNL